MTFSNLAAFSIPASVRVQVASFFFFACLLRKSAVFCVVALVCWPPHRDLWEVVQFPTLACLPVLSSIVCSFSTATASSTYTYKCSICNYWAENETDSAVTPYTKNTWYMINVISPSLLLFSTIAEHLVPLPNLSIFVHYAPVLLITPYTPTRLIHCSFNLRFMKIWKDLVFHEKKYLHNIPVLRTLRNTGEWATKCSMILKTNDWPNSNAKIQTNLLFNISSLIISSTES